MDVIPPSSPPESPPLRQGTTVSRARARSRAIKAAVVIALALIAVGILVPNPYKNQKDKDPFQRLTIGGVRGNTYYNETYGLRLDLPYGWHVASEKEREKMRSVGENLLYRERPGARSRAVRARPFTPYLLYVTKYPPSARSSHNASLILMGTRADMGRERPKDGRDLLREVLRTPDMKGAPGEWEVLKTPYEYPLGGRPFFRADIQWEIQRQVAKVSFLAWVGDPRILIVVLAWQREGDRAEMEKSLGTMTFE